MKYDKHFIRSKSLLLRKKQHSKIKKFNFKLIFNLIKKHFKKKKIIIAGYYPSNYEVNILKFLQKANTERFKIALPIIKPASQMSFKLWIYKIMFSQ